MRIGSRDFVLSLAETPEYLLVLQDGKLSLFWGAQRLCEVKVSGLPSGDGITGLEHGVGSRFTLRLASGRAFRCWMAVEQDRGNIS